MATIWESVFCTKGACMQLWPAQELQPEWMSLLGARVCLSEWLCVPKRYCCRELLPFFPLVKKKKYRFGLMIRTWRLRNSEHGARCGSFSFFKCEDKSTRRGLDHRPTDRPTQMKPCDSRQRKVLFKKCRNCWGWGLLCGSWQRKNPALIFCSMRATCQSSLKCEVQRLAVTYC